VLKPGRKRPWQLQWRRWWLPSSGRQGILLFAWMSPGRCLMLNLWPSRGVFRFDVYLPIILPLTPDGNPRFLSTPLPSPDVRQLVFFRERLSAHAGRPLPPERAPFSLREYFLPPPLLFFLPPFGSKGSRRFAGFLQSPDALDINSPLPSPPMIIFADRKRYCSPLFCVYPFFRVQRADFPPAFTLNQDIFIVLLHRPIGIIKPSFPSHPPSDTRVPNLFLVP